MRIAALLILALLGAQNALAGDPAFTYKTHNNDLEVFGYRLPTSHLPKGDSDHHVEFSQSPDSRYVVVLSYLHLEGKYDAWLYDSQTKSRPVHINATHIGRHPEITWYSNEIFSIDWAGMGYYSAGVFRVNDVNNGMLLEDPLIVDGARNVYVAYAEDVLKTGVVIGELFSSARNRQEFDFELPPSQSVLDRYESIDSVEIVGDTLVVNYLDQGKRHEYIFHPRILRQD